MCELPVLLKSLVCAGVLLLALCAGCIALALLLGPMLPRGTGELVFDDRGYIYRMDVDRGIVRQLTVNGEDSDPSWSPDGQEIAFISYRTRIKHDVFVMNADGGNVRRLTNDREDALYPAWSPKGQQVIYVTEQFGQSELMLYDIVIGNETRLTFNNTVDYQPDWSPDGQQIAFVSDRDKATDYKIYIMKADGSDVRMLETAPGNRLIPAWSPDGRYMIYISELSHYSIVLYNLYSGERVQLFIDKLPQLFKGNFLTIDALRWSNGHYEIFISESSYHSIVLYDLYNNEFVQLFTDNLLRIEALSWSTDGRYIAYSANRDIFLMDMMCVPQPETCPSTVRHLSTGSVMYPRNPSWRPG